eukprot:scaffold298_cov247-Pinguiococcus_pyrenoidosus.AAC.16
MLLLERAQERPAALAAERIPKMPPEHRGRELRSLYAILLQVLGDLVGYAVQRERRFQEALDSRRQNDRDRKASTGSRAVKDSGHSRYSS